MHEQNRDAISKDTGKNIFWFQERNKLTQDVVKTRSGRTELQN